MLIVNKKTMSWGLLLGVSFMAILVLIFSPVWGNGRNGLNFSDRLFNSLVKVWPILFRKSPRTLKNSKGKNPKSSNWW